MTDKIFPWVCVFGMFGVGVMAGALVFMAPWPFSLMLGVLSTIALVLTFAMIVDTVAIQRHP